MIGKIQSGMSLRIKLVGAGVLLVVLMGSILGFYFYSHSQALLDQQLVRKGSYIVKNLAYNARYPVFTEDKKLLSDLISGALEEKDVAYVTIVNEKGAPLIVRNTREVSPETATYVSGWIQQHPLVESFSVTRGVPGAKGLYYHFSAPVFGRTEPSSLPFDELSEVQEKDQQSSARHPQKLVGTVHLGISLDELSSALRRALAISFLIFAATIVAGFSFVHLLSRNLLRPLEWMAQTAKRIAEGDLTQRVTVQSRDEIGELARSLNIMAESVELLMEDLKQKQTELQKNYEKLESWNIELEKRVEARTYEIKEANKALEWANQELEEANRLKSEFLASTSHELRTPLNAIIGFLGLILEGHTENRDEETEYIGHAYESGKLLLALINDILDIAKIEAGKMDLHVEEVNVPALFDEAARLCHVQAENKNLQLTFLTPPDLPTVCADRGRTVQILINLLSNSIKFTERGEITVQALSQKEKGFVEITVRDTGIGISLPKDQQSVLFEKFRQVDSVQTRKFRGTGLGLSISKNLVEMMGGVITLESDGTGEGTTVTFTLPVFSEGIAPGGVVPEPAPEDLEGGLGLVLVVENDAHFRAFLTRILKSAGYGVVQAGTAQEGLQRARQYLPKIVTLDYALPWAQSASIRTAADFIREMASTPRTRDAEIIMITGHDIEKTRTRLSLDFLTKTPEILQKPINPDELFFILQRYQAKLKKVPVRLLLVNADPSLGAFLRLALPGDSFELTQVPDGVKALKTITSGRGGVDVVLLDMALPRKEGLEVLRELKLEEKAPDLPIIVMTNHPDQQSPEEKALIARGTILQLLPKHEVVDSPAILLEILRKVVR